jgi:hypothetical protein
LTSLVCVDWIVYLDGYEGAKHLSVLIKAESREIGAYDAMLGLVDYSWKGAC